MVKWLSILVSILPLTMFAQVSTIYFNEPFRLALTVDDQWYMQDLNGLDGNYIYGDYYWVEDTIFLMSSMDSVVCYSFVLNDILLKENNSVQSSLHKFLSPPALFYKQSEFHLNGNLKSLLLRIYANKTRRNTIDYNMAFFNSNGQLENIERISSNLSVKEVPIKL